MKTLYTIGIVVFVLFALVSLDMIASPKTRDSGLTSLACLWGPGLLLCLYLRRNAVKHEKEKYAKEHLEQQNVQLMAALSAHMHHQEPTVIIQNVHNQQPLVQQSPMQQPMAGWKCTFCGYSNQPFDQNCRQCAAPRPN